jgi:hypothetical protein
LAAIFFLGAGSSSVNWPSSRGGFFFAAGVAGFGRASSIAAASTSSSAAGAATIALQCGQRTFLPAMASATFSFLLHLVQVISMNGSDRAHASRLRRVAAGCVHEVRLAVSRTLFRR